MQLPDGLKLILSLILPFIAGVVGSRFTIKEIPSWYSTLRKPHFNPPTWIFAPAWTLLYLLMGTAFYLIWTGAAPGAARHAAMAVFGLHLVVNALWSFIFFGRHNLFWALVDVVVLWFLVLVLIGMFWALCPAAGMLLVPYACWVSFAMVLNHAIWQLNK